jgi:hypothetical protein
VEPLKRASGVWLAGGLPENLLDSYAGTKVETELRNVLARGGVIGGVSAGAMVLGSDAVNSGLSADRQWVVRKGFGLLRAVAYQPHAQNPRLDSWLSKRIWHVSHQTTPRRGSSRKTWRRLSATARRMSLPTPSGPTPCHSSLFEVGIDTISHAGK